VRLALVLIIVTIVLSILATLVPQGKEERFYRASYPPVIADLILATRFDTFFGSVLFYIPVGLFTVNLATCAVDRLVKRSRTKAPPRYGPDLVHLGLVLLVAGAIVTTALRKEKMIWMGEGDEVALTREYSVKLQSFQFLKYENGSPKEWISTVSVLRGGAVQTASFPIEVNRPLRLGSLRLYQASYSTEGVAHLKDSSGQAFAVNVGDIFRSGDTLWYFTDVEQPAASGASPAAVFQVYKGHALVSTEKLAPPEKAGGFEITRVFGRRLTGLKAVSDPGMFPVIAALIVVGAGLGLTYVQKLREEKR
jgi:cytochrome c biogenesis protein ResB